jgi:hypothetical protein
MNPVFRLIFAIIGLFLATASPTAANTNQLPARIDKLVAANQVGPVADGAADEEFLRRIYLDLHGMIPTAAEARKFLTAKDPAKREKLVDELLARPEFTRHMVRTLDLMLMERRKDKYVKADPWKDYLHSAVSKNRPFHQLAGEILGADGSDKDKHAAAKFLLEREAEASSLTRDIGRIFLGKDLQCAQCHDHPRIDDYLQRDYYGIYAFVNRLAVFRPDKKKPAMLSEKADGAAEFKSVFTGVGGLGEPQLPGGKSIPDPKLAKGKEWKVAPNKKNKKLRPIPAYSRHAQLAKSIGSGTNRDFRRNIANRLWAHMLGTGIVEPVDFHHSSNPPSQPALLDLLADEFAAMNFDIRMFLRTIAMTRTYQRSFAMPENVTGSQGELLQRITRTESESKGLTAAAQQAWKASDELRTKLEETYSAITPLTKELATAKSGIAKVQKTYDATKKSQDQAKKTWDDRKKRYAKTFQQAKEAKAKDPKKDDPKRRPSSIERRADSYQKQLDALEKAYDKKRKIERDAFAKLDAVKRKVTAVEKKIAEAKEKVLPIKQQILAADARRRSQTAESKLTSRKLRHLKALNRINELNTQLGEAGQSEGQRTKLKAQLEGAERETTAIWSENFGVAGLVPLTPEQLAWSMMQATGETGKYRASGRKEFEKKAKEKDAKKKPVPADLKLYVEKFMYDKMKGRVVKFISLFSAGPGSKPTAFFASADQALFFENAGDLRGWLGPSSDNLAARLRKQTEPKLFAEELYLSTLTRFPTAAEHLAVAEYLKGREKDLTNVTSELGWALLTSTEFRFKH